MTDTDNSLRLDGVTKAYGSTTAVDEIDVAFSPGDVHVVAGPNGSGKTTVFGLALGLVTPSAGEVIQPAETTLGCGFQYPSLYPDLTVDENLTAFSRLSPDGNREWAEHIVEELGLDAVRDKQARSLSGGYRKKLDISLALLKQPDFLLLDEPLNNLDDLSRRELVDFLDEYADEGHSVVISSHDIRAVGEIADRITVMQNGRVVRESGREELETPREFYLDAVHGDSGTS